MIEWLEFHLLVIEAWGRGHGEVSEHRDPGWAGGERPSHEGLQGETSHSLQVGTVASTSIIKKYFFFVCTFFWFQAK